MAPGRSRTAFVDALRHAGLPRARRAHRRHVPPPIPPVFAAATRLILRRPDPRRVDTAIGGASWPVRLADDSPLTHRWRADASWAAAQRIILPAAKRVPAGRCACGAGLPPLRINAHCFRCTAPFFVCAAGHAPAGTPRAIAFDRTSQAPVGGKLRRWVFTGAAAAIAYVLLEVRRAILASWGLAGCRRTTRCVLRAQAPP